MTLKIIGAAAGSGGPDVRAAQGPDTIIQSALFKKHFDAFKIFYEGADSLESSKLAKLCALFEPLAQEVKRQVAEKHRFCVIGGDHSAAIGTWSGAVAGWHHQKKSEAPLGLIWIDAHEDAHTMDTTPSGNIHGMPVSALLGQGDSRLTGLAGAIPKILPENLCMIGMRSFEPEENALLNQLNVKIYYMPEVQERGIHCILQEAREWVTRNTDGYGITLDLDGLDPLDAPGVSTPEPGGIRAIDFCEALVALKPDSRLLGLEIMEFNPANDIEQKTEKLIIELLKIMEKWQ